MMRPAALCRLRAARQPLHRTLAAAAGAQALQHKVVRTDAEQCVPGLMDGLAARGCELVELPEVGTSEDALVEAVKGATVLLHCYTPVTRRVF
jgi:hypothetical protein